MLGILPDHTYKQNQSGRAGCPSYVDIVFYQRHLPHWQPENAEYFITFRLTGSLPKQAIEKLQSYRNQIQEGKEINDQITRKIIEKYERLLDKAETGPTWLRQKDVAEIVQRALHYYDKQRYDLYSYSIMPNHVHLVFRHLTQKGKTEYKYPITSILQSIKSYTALQCNKILERKGTFWQAESFDRVIRDQDELENIIGYVLNNPVKANFVYHWQDWPYSYCTTKFL